MCVAPPELVAPSELLTEPQSKCCFPHATTSKVVQSQDKLASKHVLIWNCGRDMFLAGHISVLYTTAVVPAALVIRLLSSARQNKNAQSTINFSPHLPRSVLCAGLYFLDKLASKKVLIWNCRRNMFLASHTSVLGTLPSRSCHFSLFPEKKKGANSDSCVEP